jgi:Cdc6-like AAA superfamily ATPase
MWVVLGEEKGRIKLVSKNEPQGGILPKGSFLTIEEDGKKFILRVDDSQQTEPYSPAPMLADMDLSPLRQDQKCQNIVYAYRVGDVTDRSDGLIDYIRPQSLARRSNQNEIDIALGSELEGPPIFLATVYAGKNQLLCDEQGNPMKAFLPIDMFYHQILICGKTGSGKTVASKYLAQYFVEELEGYGAVLAINVKDVDFLKMDKPSSTTREAVSKEWESLGKSPHGVDNVTIYYPANIQLDLHQGLNTDICRRITIDVRELDPDALSGLLLGITDIAAQHLPNIFRMWQEDKRRNGGEFTFRNFVEYFARGADDRYVYRTLNTRGNEMPVTLPWSTYQNVLRSLEFAMEFFDNENAQTIEASDILARGKASVINVAGSKGILFGSIILRHLLKAIVDEKNAGRSAVPILIIIDEVHQFYDTASSREALGELDTICRTGRSKEIGVIFSSQNPSDMPRGLSNVVNTRIFFKSDRSVTREFGISVSSDEMRSLDKGYAVVNIHGLPQVRILKFPMAFAGVFEKQG